MLLVLNILGTSPAPAFEPNASGDEMPVAVRTIDGVDTEGHLILLNSVDGLTIALPADKQEKAFALDEVVRIINPDPAAVRSPGQYRVELTGGDVLIVNPVGGSGDQVEVENDALGRFSIPLARILQWTALPERLMNTQAAEFFQPLSPRISGDDATRIDDRIFLTNGDVLNGIIAGIDDQGFSLLANHDQEAQIPHHQVAAATIVAAPHTVAKEPAWLLRLADGSSVTLSEVSLSGSTLKLPALSEPGESRPLQWSHVSELSPTERRWTWLTRLEPISATQHSTTGPAWETQPDRNVLGHELRVAGRRFRHGLGTHSSSALVYDLKGEYTSFVTFYGIDDESGPLADVNIAIRVDGQERHAEEGVRANKLTGPVRLDVTGANRLELIVDPGHNGDIQDRFNWLDCGLVRR